MSLKISSIAASATLLATLLISIPAWADAKNIVLVHGMNMDGSSWRQVYDVLEGKGYDVSMVQLPLTGFDEDILATQRILDRQTGSVVLVGHSYGGVVITDAGKDPKVEALVYVAAIQPDIGDTLASLNESMPSAFDPTNLIFNSDGYSTVSTEGFIRDSAADVPVDEARFIAASQTPTSSDVFTAAVAAAAWKDKPTFGVVATLDRTVNPDLERWMYARSGTQVTEIEASHMVYISHAEAVAEVIIKAAESVD